ncbi:MAG: class I SAM-dependent methyltransferase [Candidatus Brocadiaceae bacterium]|nr:class I SAM-dependent methyltransferase [Candidatus Brocadiaceae bacterium]
MALQQNIEQEDLNMVNKSGKFVLLINRLLTAFEWRFRRFMNTYIFSRRYSTPCNICGGNIFTRGPGGRLSSSDKLPWCIKCWSLERHRALREFWNLFPQNYFAKQVMLQFSDDPAVNQSQFKNSTISIYGFLNSLDLQQIDRPNSIYDVVICNQVLEHVPNDRKSLQELLRVTKELGFVQLGVPSPMTLEKTEDWGYPKKEDHYHFRNYGRDISQLFDEIVGVGKYRKFIITDPVTGAKDCIFLLCHSQETIARFTDIIGQKLES